MPDPDDIIIAVNLKSLLQVKVLTEEGTYVDLEEEKEYSVVTLKHLPYSRHHLRGTSV